MPLPYLEDEDSPALYKIKRQQKPKPEPKRDQLFEPNP